MLTSRDAPVETPALVCKYPGGTVTIALCGQAKAWGQPSYHGKEGKNELLLMTQPSLGSCSGGEVT